MSTLYLLRHGQASFGAQDYDCLSSLGLRQALATGTFFGARGIALDKVLVGPRRRHMDTAQAVLAGMDDRYRQPPVFKAQALDEFAEGSVLITSAQRRLAALDRPWPDDKSAQLALYAREVQRWTQGAEDIDDCQPVDLFCRGASAWLSELINKEDRGQRLLVVTSAGMIAALMLAVLGLTVQQLHSWLLPLDNASLSELIFSQGRISLRSFNSSAHLPAELASRI